MKIAFWNINKKDLSDMMVSLVRENDIDILFVAEIDSNTLLKFLTKINSFSKTNKYSQISSVKDKIILISRYEKSLFTDKSHLYKNTRMVAFKLKVPTIIELNLISIHFHSKNNWNDISQSMECATIADAIKLVEFNANSLNTVVIGDFNMNPFEPGMIATNGFHAISDLDYVVQNPKGRLVDETSYQYFYNPMWNFFGDHTLPMGTYYFRNSGNISYEWHIFDQILIRPSVHKHLDKDYVEVIDTIETESLTTSLKRPDKSQYSDHLPIILKLKN